MDTDHDALTLLAVTLLTMQQIRSQQVLSQCAYAAAGAVLLPCHHGYGGPLQVVSTCNVVLHVPKLKEAEISTVLRTLKAFACNEVRLQICHCCLLLLYLQLHASAQGKTCQRCLRVDFMAVRASCLTGRLGSCLCRMPDMLD